jgi:hypothetical protein
MMITRAFGLRCWLLMGALLLAAGTGAHAALIPLTATLTGSQETPPNLSPGSGAAALILDEVGQTLVSAVSFSGLTSTTTSADIEDQTGLIVHPFPTGPAGFPTGVMQGSFTDVWTGLTPANVAALEAGSYSLNLRTTAFPGGEIRGQITVVPEPGSLALLGLGLLGVAGLVWCGGLARGATAAVRSARRATLLPSCSAVACRKSASWSRACGRAAP